VSGIAATWASTCKTAAWVADLDSVLAELRREGVTVDERVEETGEGRFGWITDSEGNRIELWQPPPDR